MQAVHGPVAENLSSAASRSELGRKIARCLRTRQWSQFDGRRPGLEGMSQLTALRLQREQDSHPAANRRTKLSKSDQVRTGAGGEQGATVIHSQHDLESMESAATSRTLQCQPAGATGQPRPTPAFPAFRLAGSTDAPLHSG